MLQTYFKAKSRSSGLKTGPQTSEEQVPFLFCKCYVAQILAIGNDL